MLNLTQMKKEVKANKSAQYIHLHYVDHNGNRSDDPAASETFKRAAFFKMLRDNEFIMPNYKYKVVRVYADLYISYTNK